MESLANQMTWMLVLHLVIIILLVVELLAGSNRTEALGIILQLIKELQALVGSGEDTPKS